MDLRCLGLPLEILVVLRNFSAESCGHVGVGRGERPFTPGCLHPWGAGKSSLPSSGSWGAPSPQLEVHVCASCPLGLGSGADSCFLRPSVYLYVFG